MPPPKLLLPPPRSRLCAFTVTAYLCLSLLSPFAYAAESSPALDLGQPLQHAPIGQVAQLLDEGTEDEGAGSYAPDFTPFDRSLLGRQEAEVNKLANNEKKEMDLSPGSTVHFVLEGGRSRVRRAHDPNSHAQGADNASERASTEESDVDHVEDSDGELERNGLKSRQSGRSIWISANTCRQPMPTGNGTTAPPNHPQLVMYVSTSSQNQKPGPDSLENLATDPTGVLFDGGYASFEVQSDSDVYIGVSAPNIDRNWFGSWHFEVAASTDDFFHSYNDSAPFLYMIDTDSESALFITYNISASNASDEVDKWRNQNPFKMYAFVDGDYTAITGMEHSYCALREQFNSSSTKNFTIKSSVTTKFGDGIPKSQFHVQGLDTATTYNGFVVVEENQETAGLAGVGTVRGGGKVFQQFNWTTKGDDSCQVLFDLEFCDSVAYAVPSSPEFKFNDTGLGLLYDSKAKEYYQNFNRSLAQVACDTAPEAQYSLARTCKDCERDYKSWLCSVLIPRCEEWTSDDPWLQPRNINVPFPNGTLTYDGNMTQAFKDTRRDRLGYNSSRNPMIDEIIKPGPYKEMKPCEDLCFDIVRSCPAALGFACPNSPARELSYGKRDPDGNVLHCNFPGAVVKLNVQGTGSGLHANKASWALAAFIVMMLL